MKLGKKRVRSTSDTTMEAVGMVLVHSSLVLYGARDHLWVLQCEDTRKRFKVTEQVIHIP